MNGADYIPRPEHGAAWLTGASSGIGKAVAARMVEDGWTVYITARSEVSIIKAIQGEDFFYVISRARRSDALQTEEPPLTNKEMGEWSLYMRSIKVCDPRSDKHPCPATAPQT